MGQQDLGYKRVFAHREMVEDLLRGFVREPWVAEVEMDTLERVSGTYVSDDLREREDDIIWRVRWRDRWLYIDIPEIENLQEARTMLAERVKDWKKQWQDEARKEGESTMLTKQLTRKFGPIAPDTRRRIADASSDQLLNWAERILTADKIEEVFD